jgi:hypothetical protein
VIGGSVIAVIGGSMRGGSIKNEPATAAKETVVAGFLRALPQRSKDR